MWYNQFLCEFTNAKQNPQQRCSLYLRLHHLAYAFSFPATQTLSEHLQSFLLPVIMCFGCPNYLAFPALTCLSLPCIYFPLLGIFPLFTGSLLEDSLVSFRWTHLPGQSWLCLFCTPVPGLITIIFHIWKIVFYRIISPTLSLPIPKRTARLVSTCSVLVDYGMIR